MKKLAFRKSTAIKILCGVCVAALLVGSFAFFTDRETQTATAQAGNIDLVFTDVSDATVNKQATQENTDSLVWTDKKITNDEQPILNPGDTFDMGYKLTNEGNKSIDVKQELVVTSSVAMTADAEEYQLKANGVTLTPTVAPDKMSITYTLPEIILNGTIEEEENGVAQADGQDYDLYLEFARAAANKFMDSTVEVELNIWAKQHRNTTVDDWATIASFETSSLPNA